LAEALVGGEGGGLAPGRDLGGEEQAQRLLGEGVGVEGRLGGGGGGGGVSRRQRGPGEQVVNAEQLALGGGALHLGPLRLPLVGEQRATVQPPRRRGRRPRRRRRPGVETALALLEEGRGHVDVAPGDG